MSDTDRKPLRVAVLHPSYEDSIAPFKDLDVLCNPARYLPTPDFVCENFDIRKRTAVKQVNEIAQLGFDVAFNLCDGAWEEDRPGVEVVQALERLNMAFTGAGSLFYEPTREAMKMACESVGVKFPAFVMARRPEDAERAADELRFPMIVKHPNSYASVGLTKECRVTTRAALLRETARISKLYGSALIEEFIEGREFTVLATEARNGEEMPWVLKPVEFTFPDGESFKHFEMKWVRYGEMQTKLVDDRELAERLRDVTARTFAALNGTGFGRCDIRMDAAGDLYMLEINPNCEVFCPDGEFGSADFVLAAERDGHRRFARHLVECGLRRKANAVRPWEIRHSRSTGFGLYAMRAIREGEIIEPYEEQCHTLVSLGHVESQWQGIKRDWFERYAWPVSGDVHAIWSDNPANWRPINHSCDPNTWLTGLNITARRDIAADEPLTMDYATFCGSRMMPFECACESEICRGEVSGSDHLLPELRIRYGEHVSYFVRQSGQTRKRATAPAPKTRSSRRKRSRPIQAGLFGDGE